MQNAQFRKNHPMYLFLFLTDTLLFACLFATCIYAEIDTTFKTVCRWLISMVVLSLVFPRETKSKITGGCIYRTMSSVSDGDHTQNKTKVTHYGRNANFRKQNHEIKVLLTNKTVYFADGWRGRFTNVCVAWQIYKWSQRHWTRESNTSSWVY